jgi:hypothetical protein
MPKFDVPEYIYQTGRVIAGNQVSRAQLDQQFMNYKSQKMHANQQYMQQNAPPAPQGNDSMQGLMGLLEMNPVTGAPPQQYGAADNSLVEMLRQVESF